MKSFLVVHSTRIGFSWILGFIPSDQCREPSKSTLHPFFPFLVFVIKMISAQHSSNDGKN